MPTPKPNDARFRFHEQQIRSALHIMLYERQTNFSPTIICRMATISRTTFYAHYDSKNVIEQYETDLKAEFLTRITSIKMPKDAIFAKLLKFVREKRAYFEATVPNANFWLLKEIFAELQPMLAKGTTQKAYGVYAMQQIALIASWVQYEKCAPEKLEVYARKMAYANVMRVD